MSPFRLRPSGRLVAGLLLLPLLPALPGCSSTTPLTTQLGAASPIEGGRAVTTAYTGSLQAGPCSGHFTGGIGAGPAPLTVICGPHRGTGTADLQGGRFMAGRATLDDGSVVAFREGPGPVLGEPTALINARLLVEPITTAPERVRSLVGG